MHRSSTKTYLVLFAVLLVSLSIRMWNLDKRWINPDEGAHIMDAVLLLDGNVPGADYKSRQPFYVLMIAVFLKVFGVDFVSARLLPLTCSLLTGLMVFVIARKLFDDSVATMSACLYWMMPLEINNSTLVKTEPLVTLLIAIGFYGLIRFWNTEKPFWLVGAGVFGALGYYVRESALIVPMCLFVFLGIIYYGRFRSLAGKLGYFLLGYSAIFSLTMLYYSRYMPLGKLLTSSVSPLGTPLKVLRKLMGRHGQAMAAEGVVTQSSGGFRVDFVQLREVFNLHSFLLIGLVFSMAAVLFHIYYLKKEAIDRKFIISHIFLYLWVFSLFSAYVVYFAASRFGIDYFREVLPPLCIIVSVWIGDLFPANGKAKLMSRLTLGGLLVLGFIFLWQSRNMNSFGAGFYASLTVASVALIHVVGKIDSRRRRIVFRVMMVVILGFILFSRREPLSEFMRGALPSIAVMGGIFAISWSVLGGTNRAIAGPFGRYIALSVLLAALVVNICYSAVTLGLSFNSPWSPEAVAKTAAYLERHTNPGDEILSGAVIWEVQSFRRPFHMISHPLSMTHGIPERRKRRLMAAIEKRPPKAIVLDGFTEKTYLRQVTDLTEFLRKNYELSTTIDAPAKYPVRIYLPKSKAV